VLKKVLTSIGLGAKAAAPSEPAGRFSPYAEAHVNFLYNLLFCDDPALFRNADNAQGHDLWHTLLEDSPDVPALRAIAEDAGADSRARTLAYNRLRAAGETVPRRVLFGVIVEVPLEQGLDVLAAFADGGVRYLNQSGRVAIFEGAGNPVEALAGELLAVAQPLVDRIGPWDKPRLPPPRAGNVRLSFLVSDGLYFGEGPFATLQGDALGGPVLAKAAELLQRTVEMGTR
jgi:hypothetical protein